MGHELLDASSALLKRSNFPNYGQQKLLLQCGLGQSFWNALTITGVFEARGKALCEIELPDYQEVIVEDVSETCVGHLHKGMLYAHGADEGGDPAAPEIGAHDAMWYAIRDLVFGPSAYPMPDIPDTLVRPTDGPLFPQLGGSHGQLLQMLLNLLMIEVRAESFFSLCCDILGDEELFSDRRAQAREAVELVERIRTDEAIHTTSLQVALTEMRHLTFKTIDGGTISGSDLLDPAWAIITKWHGETLQDLNRDQTRARIHGQLMELPDGESLVAKFDSLDQS